MQEEQEVCPLPTSKCDKCNNQEQVRQRQRTRSPRCFVTKHPIHTHALIGRQHHTRGMEKNQDTTTHTENNTRRAYTRRQTPQPQQRRLHRQQSVHAYVIVHTATPTIAHTFMLPLSHRTKKERKR